MTMFNLNAEIVDLDGVPIVIGADGKKLTLGEMCVNSLIAALPGEETTEGPEKRRRVKLAERIKEAAAKDREIYISPEDVARLLKLVGKLYTALPAARAMDLLDPGGADEAEVIDEDKAQAAE